MQKGHQGKAVHAGKGSVNYGWNMPAPHRAYGRQPGQPAPFAQEDGYTFQHRSRGVGSYTQYQQRTGYQQQDDMGDHMRAEIDMHAQEMQGGTGRYTDQPDSRPEIEMVLYRRGTGYLIMGIDKGNDHKQHKGIGMPLVKKGFH
jgi:hypothetical protein